MNQNDRAYFDFLDKLRESGRTNMFGAIPFLRRAFPALSFQQAVTVLQAWMNAFSREENGR